MANLDPRLQYNELVNYGSSAERSKLFVPDEFDYAVVLKNFSQSSHDLLEVCYNGEENIQAFLHPSHNASSSVSSGRVLSYVTHISILKFKHFWLQKNISYLFQSVWNDN